MLETYLIQIAVGIAGNSVAKFVPHTGNAHTRRTFPEGKPFTLRDAALIGAALPISEEFIFRGMANILMGDSWESGILSSSLFALIHNFYIAEEEREAKQEVKTGGILGFLKSFKRMRFDTRTVPIEQFIYGIFFWYLMREKGLDHSIVAHVGNNTSMAFAHYLLTNFPRSEGPANEASDTSP